jgi:hypothetical protein
MLQTGKTQTILSLAGLVSITVLVVVLFVHATGERAGGKESLDHTKYVVTSVPIPEVLDFAGELTPVENFDVLESLDRELLINTYWQSHTLLLIKRSHRYFPVIEKILAKHGIPEDFKYLPVAESDLMNLTSPARAVGYWQFLKATAQEYGLEVNNEVDERYHLEKSTEAACKFLLRSYELYGNWTMAAASYNVGRTGLNRQIERQDSRYYYDILLNEETGRYIYRLLALKLIMTEPEKYGFIFDKDDLYPPIPVYHVSVDSSVEDFAQFASSYSINYKVLKLFNPWLRDNKLTNTKGKTYQISIPRKGYREFSQSTD